MLNRNCLLSLPKPIRRTKLLIEPAVRLEFSKNGNAKSALVQLNESEKERAYRATQALFLLGRIDAQPSAFVREAADMVQKYLPETYHTLRMLSDEDVPQIIVKGLPRPCPLITTPLNGTVVESDVRTQIGFLVALLGEAAELTPFAYGSENRGLILRAVAPVAELKGTASSQGSANDLGMHNDNANQAMFHEAWFKPGAPFMNPYQAFVCLRARSDVPMETAALDDLLPELEAAHGPEPARILQSPVYDVRWPDSHLKGGQIAVAGVPVLVPDALGRMHSRYHAANISSADANAQAALDKFHRIVSKTKSVMEIYSEPGDLLIYSNTRMMHRRRAYAANFDGSDRYYVRVYLAPAEALGGRHLID
ncbi:TauD/TfdA family dioxygenase [Aestuariivirga sp.]|uniref:TauD/TfdA family dioxygenase n=1 Tax=Aestuariivirga sp. TaxID=2650926 RepID=UPI0025C57C65|nr:TauD/TfdA family dioxygenase [Aestuariivirga sp.]MCA3554806.1 TauD/TfdA family dioxygenase [Aestuariivirga sp.]